MKRQFIYILILWGICMLCFGQVSPDAPHKDRYFITNKDTIWYSTLYTWRKSDVAWLRNDRTGLYALVDSNCNVITNFEYGIHHPFYSDSQSALTTKNGKWGVVNKKGDIVIDFIYDECPLPCCDTTTNKEFYICAKNNTLGVIDSNGNMVVPFEWDNIFYCNYSIFELQNKDTTYLYFVRTNNTISMGNKKNQLDFNKFGKTIVRDCKLEKYGIIDTSGLIVQPCIYDRHDVKKFLQ